MRIPLIVGMVLVIATILHAQQYYEASGQTQVFTLTAGAKSGPSAIRRSVTNPIPAVKEMKIAQSSTGLITVSFPVTSHESRVTIFDVHGRQVFRSSKTGDSMLRIDTRGFTPGMYGVVVSSGGQSVSRSVVVSGRGGK